MHVVAMMVVVNWIHSWHIRFNCWNRRGCHLAHQPTNRCGNHVIWLRWFFFCTRHSRCKTSSDSDTISCLFKTRKLWLAVSSNINPTGGRNFIEFQYLIRIKWLMALSWCGKFCPRSHRKETISQSVYGDSGEQLSNIHAPMEQDPAGRSEW